MNDNDMELMREGLKDARWRLAVSLHEAGHIIYARRISLTVELAYHGPLEYPGRPGEFGLAGVQMNFPKSDVETNLLAVARWHCAGSVVKHVLVPDLWDPKEDATDYEVFFEHYYCTVHKDQGIPIMAAEAEEIWKAAQRDVERDLRSPAFRQEIWTLARDTESKIPWDVR